MSEKMILSPVQVGRRTLRNRMVMPAMETRMSTPDGDVTQNMIDYYAERAKGGVAAIIVENTYIDVACSRGSLVSSGFYSDHLIAGKFRLAEAIKAQGALALIQLSHAGPQASEIANPGHEALGPSAVECVGRMPKVIDQREILEVEESFVQAARRAKMAGFDGVEIHCGHGYLICSFLSPKFNQRTDEYGGSRENRARIAVETVRKVREEVGEDFIVGVRMSGEEFVEGGMTIEDTTVYAQLMEDYIDYINVSAGNDESEALWQIGPMYRPQAPIVYLASAMKKAVTKCKIMTVNTLTPELAEQALENQDADLVGFGRPLIADPQLPNKLRYGCEEDIRPCMRGHEGCISLFHRGCPLRCEINPQAGRERDYRIVKCADAKKIVVIGGGMAGMEAARVASLYGHKVTLFEKGNELGGHFIEATAPGFKSGGRGILNWMKRQLEKADVEIRMNTEATKELVKDLEPDAVIIAVGSDYIIPPIPGIENTITARTALLEPERVKDRVIVIGGGLVGSETALELARQGKQITILEMLHDIVLQDEHLCQVAIKYELKAANAKAITNARVTSVEAGKVTYVRDSVSETLEADTIVAALGLKPRADIRDQFLDICKETFVIGDAGKAGKLFNCTHDAWNVVRTISGI